MKLYSMAGTCALSVHIVLEWIGAPFEVEVMTRGDNHADAYLAINPSGQVPALQLDDGRVLTEALAILTYLADCYPSAALGGGEDPYDRYALAQLMSYLTSEVHVAFKPFFTPQRFLDDDSQFEALQAKAFVVLAPMLQHLEKRLGKNRFILAGRRSVADPYLYVLLRWAENAPTGLTPYPNLARYRETLDRDPHVMRALSQQK
jgi:glutathione S-transferase